MMALAIFRIKNKLPNFNFKFISFALQAKPLI